VQKIKKFVAKNKKERRAVRLRVFRRV